MLSSLFGDLRSIRGRAADPNREQGFAATAILESMATAVNERGQSVDSHVRDLAVSGSPADAIREHFASTRADLDVASRMITLVDPTGVWATSVIKALSDASGRPIERLHLRDQGTLRTLAMIERTTLERRNEDALRIYHANVRAPGPENAAIPQALMERSHMTVVIVGAMTPHAIDAMLHTMQAAVNQHGWRCPTLLFMLPPNAVWIANKIGMIEWPARLKVQTLNESLNSASAVWNALLGLWNRVKKEPVWAPPAVAPTSALDGFQIKVADITTPGDLITGEISQTGSFRRAKLQPDAAQVALDTLAGLDGVLACAVVDGNTGLILARRTTQQAHPVPLETAAAASARVMQMHQQASRNLGLTSDLEEVMTTAGSRHHLMRSVSSHPGIFLFAVLDKDHTNLALARYKLLESEQSLS